MQQAQVYRVEVLSQDTQKYASTHVQGGGGYVTTVNGVTTGQIDSVQSTTRFHQDQSIWVKDLLSGREMQIEFKDFTVAARPGHVLTLLFDPASGQYERIVNETTATTSFGTGKFNPAIATHYAKQGAGGLVLGTCLLVPMVNWLAGIVALVATFMFIPVGHAGVAIPGARRRAFLSVLAGVAAFIGSYLTFFAEHKLLSVPAGALSLAAAFTYGNLFKTSFSEAGRFVRERSEELDLAIESFRRKHTAKHAGEVVT